MRDTRKVMRMLLLKKLAAAWLCLVFIQLCGSATANEAGIASGSDGQALPANEQPLQANSRPAPVNNHLPEGNHQAPPFYDQQPQVDNQAPSANNQPPPVDEHARQLDNHTSPENQKDSQANSQVPQVDQAPVANSHAPFIKEGSQNNAPMQQASNNPGAAPVHRDQIVPTHGSLPPPNGQRRPPPPEGKIPPPGRAPPPPPPDVRARPHPPPKHRVPAFLIPSSELSDTFDSTGASFVYVLPSRRRQCFHHRSAKPFAFEYRVLHGGKLDIDAYVVGPDGRIVYKSYEPREGRYVVPELSQKVAGLAAVINETSGSSADLPLYTICLDNRYASWYAKVVDFSIQLVPRRRRGSDDESQVAKGPLSEELTLELDRLNVSWTHFIELTDVLEYNLYQSVGYQRQFRSEETRDRMAMEDSAYCVTMWSLLQLIVMTAVSALQVLMIRALFDEKSVLHRVWRSK